MKILISTTTFAEHNKEPLRLLGKHKLDYVLNPYKRRLSEDELIVLFSKSPYIGLIAGTEPLTRDVLRGAKYLKVISRVGSGVDNINLETAKDLNIKVYNTPDVLTDSVAELTIGLMLCCLRKIISMERNMRNRIWRKEMGSLLRGKVLGIVGLGKIGKRVAELAEAFGAKLIFYDIQTIKPKIFRQVSFPALLKSADIISIHCSSGEELITKKEISQMKGGVILINTSRGSIINEGDLHNGLRDGKIAYAALDVYKTEPYSGRLLSLHNVILTPHIGSYAREARIKMEIAAVRNLIKGLKKKR